MKYYETSALTGDGVTEMFEDLAKSIAKFKDKKDKFSKTDPVLIQSKQLGEKKKSAITICC